MNGCIGEFAGFKNPLHLQGKFPPKETYTGLSPQRPGSPLRKVLHNASDPDANQLLTGIYSAIIFPVVSQKDRKEPRGITIGRNPLAL
jgi:hypothetical protein